MRKKLSVKLSTFIKALESLGYRRCRNPRQKEWRRGNFHLNQGKGYLNVSLHVDIQSIRWAQFTVLEDTVGI
jgi:hypothetical protein